MAKLIKKLLLSASVAVGVSTVGAVPAIAAGDFTTTSVTTEYWWQEEEEPATPSPDVILYRTSDNDQTSEIKDFDINNINKILDGDSSKPEEPGILDGKSSNPGGNIELYASSEDDQWLNEDLSLNWDAIVDTTATTSLTGEIHGKELRLSSLDALDWFMEDEYGVTLAEKWFTEFWYSNETWFNESFNNIVSLFEKTKNPLLLATADNFKKDQGFRMSTAYEVFSMVRGFQRVSDPNISYINSDGNDINIGLAGHDDVASFYSDEFESEMLSKFGIDATGVLSSKKLQASEVVKYTYNGVTDYLYSFTATESGLVEQGDGASHSGNYEVTIAGVASVPEPSTMIGLMTVGGLLVAAKKKGQSKKDA